MNGLSGGPQQAKNHEKSYENHEKCENFDFSQMCFPLQPRCPPASCAAGNTFRGRWMSGDDRKTNFRKPKFYILRIFMIFLIFQSAGVDEDSDRSISRTVQAMWSALRIWWTDPRIVNIFGNGFGSDPVRLVLTPKTWFWVISGLYKHIGRHSDRCGGQNHPLGHVDITQHALGCTVAA